MRFLVTWLFITALCFYFEKSHLKKKDRFQILINCRQLSCATISESYLENHLKNYTTSSLVTSRLYEKLIAWLIFSTAIYSVGMVI